MQLKKGEVLAFKTDTVWGFGVHPSDCEAIKKIYEIKNRDEKKPLILMSNDFSNLEKYVKNIPDYAYELIKKYFPGALTLIFEKSDLCNDLIVSNGTTVGVRVPDSKEFRTLVDKIEGKVLATTSCNLSNEPPVKDYKEACEKFGNVATVIKPIDDSENENTPSTVILCKNEEYIVLRKGVISI